MPQFVRMLAVYNSGIDVWFNREHFSLKYGTGVSGPETETRTLNSIRASLLDSRAEGPEQLYAIVMDVMREEHRQILEDAMLLLGIVAYNGGRIGREPVRSQGHVHKISSHSGWSPPEIFEIWEGRAVVYMQESDQENPGKCYAITAEQGEWVIVPPAWPHMVVNADASEPMVFGAICDRGYEGFEYDMVRKHGGLAFFPVFNKDDTISWQANPQYVNGRLTVKRPNQYEHILKDRKASETLYETAVRRSEILSFVPHPGNAELFWKEFIP